MIVLRHLLAGGGASVAAPPAPPGAFNVMDEPGAGFTEIQWPHAMAAGGFTYIGNVRGATDSNDITVSSWSDAAEAIAATFELHDELSDGSSTVPDTHNAPAVLVLASGKILTAYCGHQSTTMRTRCSTSAGDISAFNAEVTIGGSDTKTYPQLAQITSTERIFLRWRGLVGSDVFLYQATSDDDGATWTTPIQLFESGTNLYSAMACDGTRIDHALIDEAPSSAYGLWSFWTDDTGMHHLAAGTFGDPSPFPWTTADLTQIIATNGGDAYPYAMSYTSDGRPVIACQSKLADPVELFEYRATDADADTWNRHDIATSDPVLTTALSMGGFAHDWTNANRAIVPRMIGGPRDLGGSMALFIHTSADDGATWDAGTLIDTGLHKPGSAVAVVNPGPKLTFLWFYGDGAESDGDPYSLGLRGVA